MNDRGERGHDLIVKRLGKVRDKESGKTEAGLRKKEAKNQIFDATENLKIIQKKGVEA